MSIIFIVLIALSVVSLNEAAKRPSYIKPCSRKNANFDQCALQSAQYALPFIVRGDRHLRIPSLNPLKISSLELQGDRHFLLKLQNVEVYGFDRIKILSVETDFEKKTMHVKTSTDRIDIIGDYELLGRLLIFSLNGKGPCKISFVGGVYDYEFQWASEIKNGVEYGKVSKINSYNYTLDKIIGDFQNLFGGDKVLGDEVNKLLNENWKEVGKDLKIPITQTFLAIYDDIVSKIYSNIPLKELILD